MENHPNPSSESGTPLPVGDAREAATVRHGEGFATTQWSVVATAGVATEARAQIAMEHLCRMYWYPIYASVRRRGYSKEDAEDLTQTFFTRLLEKNHFDGLSPERGRFRTFLLAVLKHFLANEWDKSQRQKRGGGSTHFSIDAQDAESRYRIEPADHLSPDKLYDRAWALTLLARVMGGLEASHSDNPHFPTLKPCLTTAKEDIRYGELARQTGMSEGAIRVAVHRLRKQYRHLLHAEISGTLVDPECLDDELHALLVAFASDTPHI